MTQAPWWRSSSATVSAIEVGWNNSNAGITSRMTGIVVLLPQMAAVSGS